MDQKGKCLPQEAGHFSAVRGSWAELAGLGTPAGRENSTSKVLYLTETMDSYKAITCFLNYNLHFVG